MKKLLIKLLTRLVIKELGEYPAISEKDREDGYARLFDNVKMMKNLEAMSISDTKQMMVSDCLKSDFLRGQRYGMFLRTRSIMSKAKEYYERQRKQEK